MDLELLEKQLLKFVNNNNLSLHETLRGYDIQLTVTCDLSCAKLGFVYYSRLGNYHLIINGNVNYIIQRKVFIHEIKHIVNDMPKVGVHNRFRYGAQASLGVRSWQISKSYNIIWLKKRGIIMKKLLRYLSAGISYFIYGVQLII